MRRVFSNAGQNNDLVINPFSDLAAESTCLYLAAPYFSFPDPIVEASRCGKRIQLLVGLNGTTSPRALKTVYEQRGVAIRFLTRRFHAKIYLFDRAALLGSSNLTDAGLRANREAVICLNRPGDADAVDEVRALFQELWDAGDVLTKEKLDAFDRKYRELSRHQFDETSAIESAVGLAEPRNIRVDSQKQSKERLFLEGLRQQVYEQYRPAFNEVTDILEEHNCWRNDLVHLGVAHETNRFLNFVRLTHAVGDEAWKCAPLLEVDDRRNLVQKFGREWHEIDDPKVFDYYSEWLNNVTLVFGNEDNLGAATRDQLTKGLMSLHAFYEQFRFVRGGERNLPAEFWRVNGCDIDRVKSTLRHLLYGRGDFIERLHDILYTPAMKLGKFGVFCALELFGTVNPKECPPLNGRIAKALRFLGFDVAGE